MSAGSSLTWAGIGLLCIVMLAPSLKRAEPPQARSEKPVVASPTAPLPAASSISANLSSRELTRAADGHFYADAMVNGARIHFLIDTGASIVALTPADAQRAGIALPAERATAQGAGGAIEVAPVIIERIAIGPLEARNVPGAVATQLPISLLGQSFLTQVGRVEISGDRMTLR